MSTKTSFKRVALVTASALAIAGFSAVPALAAPGTGTYTATLVTVGGQTLTGTGTAVASVAVATGTPLAYTVLGTGSGVPTALDTFTITPAITAKPTVSKLAITGLVPTVGALVNTTNTITSATSVSAFVVVATMAATGATTYTFTPDAAGTYTITHVTTSNGIAGANAVLTVTATANTGTVSSMTVSNKAVSSGNTVVNQSLTYTNNSAAISTGVASFVVGDVGKSVWTNDDGFIGTISVFTDTTHVTLATAYTGTSRVANLFWLGTLASTTVASGVVASTITGMTVSASASSAIVINFAAGTVGTAATGKITIGGTKVSFANTNVRLNDSAMYLAFTAPVTAGTYAATVSLSNAGTYTGVGNDTFTQAFTLTVTANAGLSTALSTAYMDANATALGATAYTTTTNAVPRSGAKATGTDLAGIAIILKNSDGTAHAAAPTITATIAGSGYVLVDTAVATTAVGTLRASTASADAGGLAYVHVDADGTSGTGTVTVSVTDSDTLATTVLGTFTVTSYGAATKIEVSTTNYTIGRAGGFTTGGAKAVRAAANEALGATDQTTAIAAGQTGVTTPAFIIKVTDSSGNLVNLTNSVGTAIVPTITSDTLATSGGGTCIRDTGTDADYSSGTGVGYYNCNFSSASSSVSGGKATLTIKTPNPADTTLYLTATVAITLGGKIATETITTDATSYEPGAGMTITQSATDASGKPVFDGAAAPAITANKALGGTTPAGGFYLGGKLSSDTSRGAKTVFAPAVGGTLTLQETSGNAAGSTVTASVTIVADSAASDASALALDAANAATDAANNAYDEAQNATQAASDALAAVTALAAQVTSLIESVKKLTAAVAAYKKRMGK